MDTWLTTLAQLRHGAVILVREPEHVPMIAPTTVPILCIPNGPDVMDLTCPT